MADMKSVAGAGYLREESATEVAGYERTRGFTTTKGQEYEVALCSLLYLRALRHATDFFLASNHDVAGMFDDVVLLYRLEGDQGHGYRAILLQAKHRERVAQNKLTSSNPFSLNDYLKSFNEIRHHWEHQLNLGNREIQFREIIPVLYTNTGCEIGDKAVDVTDKPEMQHLNQLLNTGGRLVRISEGRGGKLFKGEKTSHFLSHLLLCLQQTSVQNIDRILEQELYSLLKLKSSDFARKLMSELRRLMKAWWSKKGRVTYLTPESEEWKKILDIQVKRLNGEVLTVDRQLNIKFSSAALEKFDVVHRGFKTSWICVSDEYQATAVKSRLFRAQRNSLVVDFKSLDEHLEEIKTLWSNNICPTLVLDMSTVSPQQGSQELLRLQEAVQSDAARNLIVIAKERPRSRGWKTGKAVSTWSVLHKDTRDSLLRTPVTLQGQAVAFRDVVGGQVSQVMTDQVIAHLSGCEKPIVLGTAMPAPLDYYVPRCLERTSLNANNINLSLKTNRLIFSPSHHLLPDEFKNRFKMSSQFDIKTENHIIEPTFVKDISEDYDIRQLCFRFRVPGVSGEISMKGLGGNVKEFVPFTWNCEEKIVVIEGPPGVGKSSFVTMMCSRVKERFPEAWVLRLDLGRHTDYIKDVDFTQISDVKQLLLRSLHKDASDLEWKLLEHSLTVTGNVFLFLDAFDETNPDYTRQCSNLLKGIARTLRYRQLVVTTRPVTTRDVEEALQTRAFSLPVFNEEEQRLFLKQFSAASGKNVGEEEISSVYETAGSVLQIPLLCRMAAEVLLQRRHQRLHQFVNPWRRVLLYQLFVDQSVTERGVKKFGVDLSIPGANTIIEASKKTHLENLQGLSVRKLMLPFSVSTTMPDEKLGFVVKTRGRVDFEHETFAEYFLGCWLACHWQQCPRELLHDVLFRDGFEFVAATFNWSLFEGFPLHVAVAQGDEDAVRALLAPGTTDRGGRTALHVAAMTQGDHRRVWELLVASGVDLNKKDDVLETSSIRYAAISSNWDFVDAFVEEKGNIQYNAVGNAHMKDLIHAVRKDLTGIFQAILHKQNGNFYQFDNDGNTLLHLAAASNSIKVMKLLIKMRHKLNVRNKSGYTPLHMAMELRNIKALRLLVESGADLNIKNDEGDTPLMDAAHEGHLEAVKLFSENGASLNVKADNGFTALTLAAAGGHPEVVKLLIEKGGDLNMRTDDGFTALMEAGGGGHHEVVKILLENGADLNMKTDHGFTALTLTVLKGHLQVVKLLLENGADLNVKTDGGDSALTWAAYEGHLEVVKVLLEYGADLNIKADYGDTALMLAARGGHLEVVKALLDKGADVNIRNMYSDTALTWAALEGHLNVVKILLDNGAVSNTKTDNGQTALMAASRGGHLEVLKTLIEKGDDLNTKADNGFTALTLAAHEGHLEVVKLLVANGADVNAKYMKEESALMLAAREGHLEVVKMLIENGADVNARYMKEESALMLAAHEGHQDVVAFLTSLN